MTLVYLHGWPLDERMWDRQVERFGGTAVRLYGRGNSIDGWAQQLSGELDGELTLVGHSMGGYAALAIVRLVPERVRSLVLVGARAGRDTSERRAFRNELIARLHAEEPPKNAADGVTVEELVAAQEAIRDRRDVSDVVRSFAGPFVIGVGTDDELLTVAEAEELASLAQNGRVEIFERAGHFMSLDRPEQFDALVATLPR